MVTAGGEGDQTREVKREFNQKGFVGELNQIKLYWSHAPNTTGK